MHTLVVLSAVVAAALARPGLLEDAPSPIPDAVFSEAALNQDPAPGIFSDAGTRYVDNPHVGLPFGTVLPLSLPISEPLELPIDTPEDMLSAIRSDSPHAGLPSSNPEDPPVSTALVSTALVSRPIGSFQTGNSPDGAFGKSLYNILTEVPLKSDSISDLRTSKLPGILTVNNGDVHFTTHSKNPFVNNVSPGFSQHLFPSIFPTQSTHVFVPVSSSIADVPGTVGQPVKSVAAGVPLYNGNFLVNNPYGGFFTNTAKFLSKSPSSIFPPTSGQGKFHQILPVNSATINVPLKFPTNTASFAFPSSTPNTYPFTNVAFTVNNAQYSLPTNTHTFQGPITSPSKSLLVNSANVLLFSDNSPWVNVINTPQGAVLVGGPTNFAIFPHQTSPKEEVNQVVTAHKAPEASAAHAPASPPPATIYYAGRPVSYSSRHSR